VRNKFTRKLFPSLGFSAQEGSEDEGHTVAPSWETFLYQDPSLRKYEENEAMGYGVERCLYELNLELACLSPCLIHAAALTPVAALLALEDVAAQPNRPAFPVDRHLAAFFMSRWKEMNFLDMREMNKPQREIKNLAVLRILTGIQSQFKLKELPNLCQWMSELCAPIITHYHNLKARARVQDEITKAVATGQLVKLVRALENRQAMTDDRDDYQLAKIEVMLIESELREIEAKILNRNQGAPGCETGILGWPSRLLYWLKDAKVMRKATTRAIHLHQQTEILQESWGEGLMPKGSTRASRVWEKMGSKVRGYRLRRSYFKKSVDAHLKYD
jgi:hypothetical protein